MSVQRHCNRTATQAHSSRAGAFAIPLLLSCLHFSPSRLVAQQAPAPSVLTLRSLLDSVQAGHPMTSAAESRVRAARGSRVTAGTFGNPTLSYQVDDTPFPGGRPIAGVDREAMTMVMIPLEPLFQRGPRSQRADADIRAAEADVQSMRQRIALDAARAYYRVALAEVSVATARDLTAWLDSVVIYNRARVAEGVTSEADLIRSGLERDRATADAAMQEAELAQARAELSTFLGSSGRARSASLRVALDSAPLVLPALEYAEAVPASAARPDVRAARERLDAASAGIAAEQRSIVRQLGATIGTKQMAGTTSMIAGFALPIPLFDTNRGEIRRATAERDAAGYEVVNRERMAAAEVSGALEAARILTESTTRLSRGGDQSFLTRADEGRRITLGAYREGAVPLLQVMDAARAWGDAR
ncbi:MAG: TolC family protein, partial [bacterium]